MSTAGWEEAVRALPTIVMYGEHKADVSPPPTQRPNSFLEIYTKVLGTQLVGDMEEYPSINTPTITSESMHRLCLYKLAMDIGEPHLVSLNYNRPRISRSVQVGFYIAYAPELFNGSDLEYEDHEMPYRSSNYSTIRTTLNAKAPGTRLVGMGIYCSGILESSAPLPLLEMTRLSIVKMPFVEIGGYDYGLDDLEVIQRGQAPHTQRRLAWKWRGSPDQWPTWLPWSATTGPFSHFTITVNGRWLGVVHCLEFPLLESDQVESDVEVHVRGHLFGDMPTSRPVVARVTL